MAIHVRSDALRNVRRFGSVMMLCLVLASCGLGDDEDGDAPTPTGTSAPMVDSQTNQTQEIETPTQTSGIGTPESPFTLIPASPAAAERQDSGATPDLPSVSTPGEPATTPGAGSGSTPAPVGESSDTATPDLTSDSSRDTEPAAANAITGSDGTSGATDSGALLATPESSPEPDTTPAAGSSLVEVDSCDVAEAPQFSGNNDNWVVTEDLNFRSGPGSDCDSVLDDPLIAGTAVTVLSDPVVRSDDADGVLWVQVEVDGDIGWVAADFIEPDE